MKAVILLGGEGTRLRPLTYDLPKPMCPIVNKPFMEHLVDHLLRHGFDEIVFALGYKSESFQAYFGDGSRWNARFWHVVEDFPLNTAGPVKNVEHLLGDSAFLVFNGDVLSDFDLRGLVRTHRELGAVGTLALWPVDDPSHYGVVETDAEKRVKAFIEKPPPGTETSNAINAGVYVLEPSVLRYIPAGKSHSFERQLFPDLVAAGEKLCATVATGYWLDIGSPQRYLQAHADVLEGAVRVDLPAPLPGTRRWIGEGAAVDGGALLEGPVWIGEGTRVEAGAKLIGPVTIGPRCLVGPLARVERSVVWEGTEIEGGASLVEAIVGRDSRIARDVAVMATIVGSRETRSADSSSKAKESVSPP